MLTLLLFSLVPSSKPFAERYVQLSRWDSTWYNNIATNGYIHTGLPEKPTGLDPTKENVAFFPAYPLVGRLLHAVTRIPVQTSLLLASQVACWGMATYLLLILRRWQFPFAMSVVTVLLIFSHPAAYYLVTAYSESLFFFLFLGVVYFQEQKGREVLTILHGIPMSATRILGIPLSIYPLLRSWRPTASGRAGLPALLFRKAVVSASMMLGGFLFFLYCQIQFGTWNLYMKTQYIGWGVWPDYGAVFRLETYKLLPSRLLLTNVGEIGALAVTVSVIWFLLLLSLEATVARRRDKGGWQVRLPLLFSAFLLFFFSVSSMAPAGMISIIRHMFGVHLCLALVTMHLLSCLRLRPAVLHGILAFLIALSIVLLKIQSGMVESFLRGEWVAMIP